MAKERINTHRNDEGFAWVIATSAFFLFLFADGAILSFGVFFTTLVTYFDADRTDVAWVGSLLTSMPMLAGPIAAKFIKRFGHRKVSIVGSLLASVGFLISSFVSSVTVLCITMGFITGLGLACVFISAIVSVSFYFEKYRSMATGIATCGSGIGMFIYSPLIQYMIDEYGWRGATLIMSGLFLHMIVFSACLHPLPEEQRRTEITKSMEDITGLSQRTVWTSSCTNINTDGGSESMFHALFSCRKYCKIKSSRSLTKRVYIIFWLSNFILYMWYDTFYIYLQEQVAQFNISHEKSALLLSIIGILNTIGLLLYGFLGDMSIINVVILYAVSIMICGVSIAVLPLLSTFSTLATCAAVFGFTISANYALESIVLVKLVGLGTFTEAYGCIYLGQGVSNLIGPPLAGLIYDNTGTYNASFYISGIFVILSGAILFPICKAQAHDDDGEEGNVDDNEDERASTECGGERGALKGEVSVKEILS